MKLLIPSFNIENEHLPNESTYYGSFNCSSNRLTQLKNCPAKIIGNFICSYNNITSLEGACKFVSCDFYCANCKLTSLTGVAETIGGNFWCEYNKLTTLRDIHKQITKIGKDFVCAYNPISSHILGLMMIEIGGEIKTELGNRADVDQISNMWKNQGRKVVMYARSDVDLILNKWKNQGRRGVMGAMKELMDLGYEELAQL